MDEDEDEEISPWIHTTDREGEFTLVNPDFDPNWEPEGGWEEEEIEEW